MAALPANIVIEGKSLDIYTYAQLERLGKEGLKQRGLTMRDACGGQLGPMPRHPEGLIKWMLEAQLALLGRAGAGLTLGDFGAPKEMLGGAPPSGLGMPGDRAPPTGARGGRAATPAGSEYADSEAQQAYSDAFLAREAAMARNRGSTGIF